MMRTDALSAWCTPVLPRRCRLRLVFFLVRMWRRYAWPRLIPPPARLRKRFAAARLVFNLGTFNSFFYSAGCLPGRQGFGNPDNYFFSMPAAASAAALGAASLADAAVFFCTA